MLRWWIRPEFINDLVQKRSSLVTPAIPASVLWVACQSKEFEDLSGLLIIRPSEQRRL